MLTLIVASDEGFDDEKQQFVNSEEFTLNLEHSLVSLAKWESKFEKPFLGPKPRTSEETMWYIEAMCVSSDVPPRIFKMLRSNHLEEINAYVNAKMTATTFSDKENSKKGREIITAEVIYYWMISLNIPLEWENRHLERLMTLIRVCNQKNQPAKKMSPREAQARQRDLNEQRKAQMGTRG
jgi:hypothetical protein